MAQLVTRIDDDLAAALDALIEDGAASSRSDAVRIGLTQMIEQHMRQKVGDAIAEAYRRTPQTDEEIAGLDDATRALIEEEPW